MKELYQNAEVEVVKFSIEDVITTSSTTDTTAYVPHEDDGEPDWDAFN